MSKRIVASWIACLSCLAASAASVDGDGDGEAPRIVDLSHAYDAETIF